MDSRFAIMGWCLIFFVGLALIAPVRAYGADVRIGCGTLSNPYGPYDYNNAYDRIHKLPIVEKFHFTRSVRMLEHGSSGSLPGDLDYTLRAFPNHPYALYAMARWQLQHGDRAGPNYYTAECYFKRAIKFRPKDGVVWMIYGIFLQRKGELEAALQKYLHAKKLIPKSPELDYNLGLLYVKLKKFAKARQFAELAYKGGYPLPGLRDKLKAAGKWKQDR